MTVYFPDTHTAAEWAAKATRNVQRSAESWERSDTDGFLTQWAGDTMASLYRFMAELVTEHNSEWEFRAIFDLDGNLLDAREVETRYGWAWAITTPNGTVWFNESQAQNEATARRNNAKKGYYVGRIAGPVVVTLSNGLRPSPICLPARDAAQRVIDNGH